MRFRYVNWEVVPAEGATQGETIGLVTLNRPDRHNAMGPRMAIELDALWEQVRHSDVRAVVITGAGGTFCSGGDLKEETLPLERPEDDLGIRGEYGEIANWVLNEHFHVIAQRSLWKLEELPQPVIAAIDGAAVGAGFEMTLACDFRIVTERVRLSEIAVPAGFVSEWSCPRNLPKLVGLTLATELILTGRFVYAEEAKAIGLVNKVVPVDQLMPEALAMAGYLARLPKLSVRYAKELIRMYNFENRTRENSAREIDRVLEIIRTPDAAEGITALLERRAPRWGRPPR